MGEGVAMGLPLFASRAANRWQRTALIFAWFIIDDDGLMELACWGWCRSM